VALAVLYSILKRKHGTAGHDRGSGARREMKVTCAWCQNEGQPAILGERAPLDNPAETHGICRRHTVDLLNRMPSRSFPGVRLLLVVGAKETALYEHLQRELAGVSGVKVMLDRRRGDRQEEEQTVAEEHHGLDRRIRQGEVSALGYTIIRFGKD